MRHTEVRLQQRLPMQRRGGLQGNWGMHSRAHCDAYRVAHTRPLRGAHHHADVWTFYQPKYRTHRRSHRWSHRLGAL